MHLHLRQQDLAGRTAVITGASRGIGRAIAANLAMRGANILATCTSESSRVLIHNLRDDVKAAYGEKTQSPPTVQGIVVTLDDLRAHELIADAIAQFYGSSVDVFVSNAAAVERTPVGDLNADSIAKMCLSNIQTPAMIIDEMVKRRYFRQDSRIIFISSAETSRCAPEAMMYATTKAANEAMARCYANAFGGSKAEFTFMQGTTANSVCIGLTETDGPQQFGEQVFANFQEYWVSRQSLPRLGQPEDVADVVGLLCSKEARWITGSKVSANGGSIKIL